MKVPFLDLRSLHSRIQDELDRAMREVIDSTAFIGGPALEVFEQDLAGFMETSHARGVASCTAGLTIALRSLDLQPGDEVITTVHTAIPTAEAITLAGASVVFADIEEDTFQIDPDHVESVITSRTRAILPVHLYGLAARIDRILEIAERHNLVVIEDVAQAQGARFQGRRLGTFGKAGCLSFFPSKNLGGFGDGGAVVTNDADLDRYARMCSNHGRLEKFIHQFEGANERLDGLQAALLAVKLHHLDKWNVQRREVACWYREELSPLEEVRLPEPIDGCEPVWHLYVIRIPDRDGMQRHLRERDIGTGLHYPMSLNMQPAFQHLGRGEGSFPVAEKVTQEILSLPMDPFLTRAQVHQVGDVIREYFQIDAGA